MSIITEVIFTVTLTALVIIAFYFFINHIEGDQLQDCIDNGGSMYIEMDGCVYDLNQKS